MKNKAFLWVIRAVFLLALICIISSVYQIYYSRYQVDASLKQWEEKRTKMVTSAPLTAIKFDQQKTGDQSHQTNIENQTVISNKGSGFPLYSGAPAKGEVFGKVAIPKIGMEFPIIEGTDENELAKGVGHYIGSSLPGEPDNTVLAGHRDTVFTELGKVGIGDLVQVETEAGSFTYKITSRRIVSQNDRTVIVPYGHAVLTLITCYPFNFIGSAPERYILVGDLVR